MKLSIAIFSTYFGRSFKSQQIVAITNALKSDNIRFSCYALDFSLDYFFVKKNKGIYLTAFPLLLSKIYTKFNLGFLYNSYWNYLISEYLYFRVYKKFVLSDKSNIIICKNRPVQLLRFVKKNSKKVIILEVDQLHPLFTQKIVSKECQRLGIKLKSIYTEKIAVNNYLKAFQYADFIVAYSEYQKKNLSDFGVNKPIFVNELGTDFKINSQKLVRHNNEIAYVCFANHSVLKGTHLIIDAWLAGNISHKLFIVGSQEKDFKILLKKYAFLPQNIQFIESFTSEDLIDLSLEFNLVGMLNSLSEGYSRVVNEYLALGIPVILSNVNDRNNIDHYCGFIVDPLDLNSIIKSVLLLNERIKYDEFRMNCTLRVVRTYDDFARDYISLIKGIQLE